MSSSPARHPLIREDQGQALVNLARQTLLARFKRALSEDRVAQMESHLQDPELQAGCGTFVTLKIGGELRGCIGTLSSREAVVDGVRSNAVNAAFHDPRFRPLSEAELPRIAIEVSVLSHPEPLEYKGADDLAAKLRPHVDGVTLRKGLSSATFLPQVWEQLPDVSMFLSHLCLKAGLAKDAWRQGDLEIETYQVQYFEESS